MIAISHLSKAFGSTQAVHDVSFEAHDGKVTGFVGPNGAGKSSTLRCLVGLDTPDEGTACFDGHSISQLERSAEVVGALLDPSWVHPGRSALAHLNWVSQAAGLPAVRAREVLAEVGLSSVATKRVGEFSLGMRQRLGLATALLGDPRHLVLDEPLNGLDPEGVRWMRGLLRRYADDGRCVLVSSHLLSELELIADDLVLLARGELVAQGPAATITDAGRRAAVLRYEGPDDVVRRALTERGWSLTDKAPGELEVAGATTDDVGRVLAESPVVILQLSPLGEGLEDAVLRLTGDKQEYIAGGEEKS